MEQQLTEKNNEVAEMAMSTQTLKAKFRTMGNVNIYTFSLIL